MYFAPAVPAPGVAAERVSEIAADTTAALVAQLTGEASPADVQAAVAQVVKG